MEKKVWVFFLIKKNKYKLFVVFGVLNGKKIDNIELLLLFLFFYYMNFQDFNIYSPH